MREDSFSQWRCWWLFRDIVNFMFLRVLGVCAHSHMIAKQGQTVAWQQWAVNTWKPGSLVPAFSQFLSSFTVILSCSHRLSLHFCPVIVPLRPLTVPVSHILLSVIPILSAPLLFEISGCDNTYIKHSVHKMKQLKYCAFCVRSSFFLCSSIHWEYGI